MSSKTPQFDRGLNEYYSKLILDKSGGQWRTCQLSGEQFYIRPEDIDFYKRIRVPLPTLSPTERWRRLFAYLNTHNLFKIRSAHSGKDIVAAYPPNTPLKIYEHQIWFSDEWDAFEYGRKWSNDESFFKQFTALRMDVPRPSLNTDPSNINSDYTNTSANLKNCYLTFDTLSGEDLYYFACCDGCKNCIDCDGLWNCDTCYNCQIIYDSYRCFFCYQSRNCMDSYFLYDCRSCEKCFMCSNLRSKKYCFFNEQLSREEYEEKIKSISLGNYDELQRYLVVFDKLKINAKHKPDHNFRSVSSVGEYIEDSKNCYSCLFMFGCENMIYSMGGAGYKDCSDIAGGGGGELCHELATISSSGNYNIHFSHQINLSRDLEYCDLCRNCNNCFGCIGLDNKSFCIFNVQYTENEYWKIVDEIKTTMLVRGEYGEFFPPDSMPVPYKLSLAAIYPGFHDYDKAKRYGYNMEETATQKSDVQGEVIEASALPINISDINDDIVNKVIADRKNDKYFQILKYELDFYRKHNLALPREHPLIRLSYFRDTYDLRLTFYGRTCKKCGVKIQSTFDPALYQNVYCEQCYNSEVA